LVELKQEPSGWVVNFAYGRRGRALNASTKTPSPIPYSAAKRKYDALVAEKMGKGYGVYRGASGAITPVTVSSPSVPPATTSQSASFLPQLLCPVEESAVETYLSGSQWFMQEKKDGQRCGIRRSPAGIEAYNRKGQVVTLGGTVEAYLKQIPGNFLLDGELVGDCFFAFDVLETGGEHLRSMTYENRLAALSSLLRGYTNEYIRIVPTARTEEAKRTLYDLLKEQKREGVVFKKRGAPHVSGRPNSSATATQVKVKFYATCTAIVTGINDQRSVRLGLFHQGTIISIGNVTIPANHEIPEVSGLFK